MQHEIQDSRGYRRRQCNWEGNSCIDGSPVGAFPEGATPEGVMDLLGFYMGEWCVNKYVAQPTPAEVMDHRVDLSDVETHRVVRGYPYRRYGTSGSFLADTVNYHLKGQQHPGMLWTRRGDDPITAPRSAARYGFRVVIHRICSRKRASTMALGR